MPCERHHHQQQQRISTSVLLNLNRTGGGDKSKLFCMVCSLAVFRGLSSLVLFLLLLPRPDPTIIYFIKGSAERENESVVHHSPQSDFLVQITVYLTVEKKTENGSL